AMGDIPNLGHTWVGIGAMAWDLQNTHVTIWNSWGNDYQRTHYFNHEAPAEYLDGIKCGSPAGLQQVMK
ncbi:MAG: hypothetical protein ACREQD_15745, partial [Candidatus Binataceae bacterium]